MCLHPLLGSILEEGHKSRLSLHLGMTKMYQDLKETFWWQRMKKEVEGGTLETRGRSTVVGGTNVEMGQHLDGFCDPSAADF